MKIINPKVELINYTSNADELFEDILKIDKMIENGLYYRNKSLASEL